MIQRLPQSTGGQCAGNGCIGVLLVLWVIAFGEAMAGPPAPARQAEILRLLRNDCGACHGMTLRGGLGPPLTSDALAAIPPGALVETIRQGRAGTAMPPWVAFLDRDETRWLVERLLSGSLDPKR